MTVQKSSYRKVYKVWWKFKGEEGDQLTFDFYNERVTEWTGPFHFHSNEGEDSEIMLALLYNNYDDKKKLIYKITGTFRDGS